MALTDYKITESDISGYGVASAPDKLTGTVSENKAVFDNLISRIVRTKLNSLIDALVTALNGKMAAPDTEGDAGQYLQTDGRGGRMWSTPAGAGDMLQSTYDTDGDGVVDTAAACTGNAATATALSAARKIGNASFDGTANITLSGMGAAAASHSHAASDISSGTLSSDRLPTVPVAKGGTGATTAANARANLGAAAASHTHAASDIGSGTLSSDRLPTVPVAKGGTGAATAAEARANLGAASDARTGGGSQVSSVAEIAAQTAALGNGKIFIAGTDAELGDILSAGAASGVLLAKQVNGSRVDYVLFQGVFGRVTAGTIDTANNNAATYKVLAEASHSHAASDIGSGTLNSDRLPTVPVAKGGTGATTAANARTNLGAAAASHTHGGADITSPALATLGARRIYCGTGEPGSGTGSVGDIYIKY